MKGLKKFLGKPLAMVFAAVLAGCLVMTACDNGGGSPTVTGVTVTSGAAFAVRGETLQLKAKVTGENSPSQTVIWSIETGGRNEGTSIGLTSGLLEVADGEQKESLEIKAISQQDISKSKTMTVPVITRNTNEIASVEISGTLEVGEVLTATAKDSDGAIVTDAAFQWKSSNESNENDENEKYNFIIGAERDRYTLTKSDEGKCIQVEATNAATKVPKTSTTAAGPVPETTLPTNKTGVSTIAVNSYDLGDDWRGLTVPEQKVNGGTWRIDAGRLAVGISKPANTEPVSSLNDQESALFFFQRTDKVSDSENYELTFDKDSVNYTWVNNLRYVAAEEEEDAEEDVYSRCSVSRQSSSQEFTNNGGQGDYRAIAYLYVNADVTISRAEKKWKETVSGYVAYNCTFEAIDLPLKKGWNLVQLDVHVKREGNTAEGTYTLKIADKDVPWTVVNAVKSDGNTSRRVKTGGMFSVNPRTGALTVTF